MPQAGRITVAPPQGQLQARVYTTTGASRVRRQRSGPNLKKYSDKFIRYVHAKKKLVLLLAEPKEIAEPSVTDTSVAARRGTYSENVAHVADVCSATRDVAIDEGPKKSLLFLSQGLKSNDMLKLRADLGRFHINISQVPLRI